MGDIVVCPIEDKLCQGGGVMCYFTVRQAREYLETTERQLAGYASACREIIRLNDELEKYKNPVIHVPDDELSESEPQYCQKCWKLMQQIRPGKWQCPECE